MGLKIKSTGLGRGKGWKNEPIRHGLARKGVKTKIDTSLAFRNKELLTEDIQKSLPKNVKVDDSNFTDTDEPDGDIGYYDVTLSGSKSDLRKTLKLKKALTDKEIDRDFEQLK